MSRLGRVRCWALDASRKLRPGARHGVVPVLAAAAAVTCPVQADACTTVRSSSAWPELEAVTAAARSKNRAASRTSSTHA